MIVNEGIHLFDPRYFVLVFAVCPELVRLFLMFRGLVLFSRAVLSTPQICISGFGAVMDALDGRGGSWNILG